MYDIKIDQILASSHTCIGLGLCALLAGCGGLDEGRGGSVGLDDDGASATDGTSNERDTEFDDGDGSATSGQPGDDADSSDSGAETGDAPGDPGVCGDAIVDATEDCDDGVNDGSYGGCNADCSLAAFCGDGLRNGTEEVCDDGNMDSSDGCLVDCSIPTSCEDIKAVDPDAADGSFMIDPDGEGGEDAILVYCDMSVLVTEWGDPKEAIGTFGNSTDGADVALGEIGAGPGVDMLLFYIDDPAGENQGFFRIGWNLDEAGDPTIGWSETRPIPGWFGARNEGGGVSLADIDDNGQLDLVVTHIDDPDGPNEAYYRIGWNLDIEGQVTGGWTEPFGVPGQLGNDTGEGGATLIDLDGNGDQDLVMLYLDEDSGEDEGHYQIGWNLDSAGHASHWSGLQLIPGGFGGNGVGAGLTAVQTAPDGPFSLVVFHIDDPWGANRGFYRIGRQFNAAGVASGGWSEPTEIPGWWGNSGHNGGVASWDLGSDGESDLLFFHIDSRWGANPGYYRWGYTGL